MALGANVLRHMRESQPRRPLLCRDCRHSESAMQTMEGRCGVKVVDPVTGVEGYVDMQASRLSPHLCSWEAKWFEAK